MFEDLITGGQPLKPVGIVIMIVAAIFMVYFITKGWTIPAVALGFTAGIFAAPIIRPYILQKIPGLGPYL